MSTVLSTTLIAVAAIGVAGAALCTGHCSFDQFAGLVGLFGGGTAVLHVASPPAGVK